MNYVQRARAELGLTQEQFAERMGVPTQEQVAAWESGNNPTMPNKAYRALMMPLAARHLIREVSEQPDEIEENIDLVVDMLK